MPELEKLRRLFAEAVIVGGPYQGEHPLTTPLLARVSPLCWFRDNIPGIDDCEGEWGADRLEAAHWIKRQRVEAMVAQMLEGATIPWAIGYDLGDYDAPIDREEIELLYVPQAAWDPRNAVPACEKHHRRFDSQRMPTLVVPRRLVPRHVCEFVTDWGLETALEDRNPEEVYDAPC